MSGDLPLTKHIAIAGVCLCIWAGALSASTHAYADETEYEVGALIYADSRGVFRGQKSKALPPAIGAALTFEYGDFYSGAYAEPVKIAGELTPLVLAYAGYGSSIEDFDWTIGGRYYAFPGSSDFVIDLDSDGNPENVGHKGFYEIVGGASYPIGDVDLSASVFYSPNVFGETGGSVYVSSAVTVPLGNEFDLVGRLSFSEFAKDEFNDDYMDYSIGVYREFFGLDMYLRYSDTVGLGVSDDRVLVFGISKSLTLASSDLRRERRHRKVRNLVIDKSLFFGGGAR